MSALERLFNPRGIAVVGARREPRGGGQPLNALLSYGYAGRIYPVNPKYDELAGIKCYRTLRDIDGPCDLAVIAIPAGGVVDAVKDCGSKGISYAVVYSGAFREAGEEGAARERELVRVARACGVRLVGPNCLGIVNIPDRVYAAFGGMTRKPQLPGGCVSIVSQSGGLGRTIALRCAGSGVGFRYLISSGNEVDITAPELIDACLEDPATRVVVAYIEGVADGRALMRAGRKAAQLGKAVIVWKVGNTDEGKRAAASHTASMTGSYEIYQAAFKQAGMIEVRGLEEIADLVKVFSAGRLPRGRRVALMSASGGAAIVFADAAAQNGLSVPPLATQTLAALKRSSLEIATAGNPIDLAPGFLEDDVAHKFVDAVIAVLNDPGIDMLCVMFMTILGKQALNGARALVLAAQSCDKPILVFTAVSRDTSEEAYAVLEEAGIPMLSSPAALARVAAAAAGCVEIRGKLTQEVAAATEARVPHALPAEQKSLNEVESKRLLAQYGITTTRDVVVPAGQESSTVPLHPPFAVKVISADIPHKTEAGGVKLNIPDHTALRVALIDVLTHVRRAAPAARIDGMLVSEMITEGTEILVGALNDAVFGPVVGVGLGGIFTEVLHDMSYRVAPFDRETALEMLRELRGRAIFDGVRGKPPLDIDALAEALVAVSRLAWDLRERLQELDINPLLVRPRGKGVVAADALVVLGRRDSTRVPAQ